MTVISNVKETLATAKSIQAQLGHFAEVTEDPKAKSIFHESMMEMDSIIHDLKLRVNVMKAEEKQYRDS